MALTSTLRISLIGLNSYTEICHALKLRYYTQRGLLIAKDNLFRFPWESKTQLAIRGTIADHILRETQPTDSGQLNADLNDSRQEEHSSHPGPGLENEPFSSVAADPVSSITQGTQLPDSVALEQSTTAALSNTSCTSVNELTIDPSQWTMQSQQAFELQELGQLASFDVSLLPLFTHNASDTSFLPIADTENDFAFGDIVSYDFPS
ncbi:hypothetical protein BPOR_0121g00160 [Botrytis porri]|uniref:Uncharacterized protein n=1 Tax=Botrytis porri TaxID=87229 RepID=A0A4Z1KX64_9HELO|nr:hypothetical protein BPOR_0121g00160 [Botrytis porri]